MILCFWHCGNYKQIQRIVIQSTPNKIDLEESLTPFEGQVLKVKKTWLWTGSKMVQMQYHQRSVTGNM